MGGKSSPPPPDYSGLTAATNSATATSERLATRQMDFAQRQYDEMKPLAERVAASQISAQDELMRQGRDYYDYQKETFRPLEKGLVAQAQNYNTEANRAQLAAQASADAANAFQSAQGVNNREMARRGINASSGAALMMRNQNALGLASMTAGASNTARRQAEQTGWARSMDVTGLGRGLSGASLGAYGGANASGTAGLNSAMSAGNQYGQAFGQGAGYAMGGAQMGITGNTSLLNSQTSAYNAGMAQQGLDIGGILAGGAKAYTAFSDRRLKENVELVGRDERTMLPLYEFEYIGGSGKRYLGVMAQDVIKTHPEMVYTMPDGFMAVNYAGLGIEMLEVDHAS